MPALVAVEAVVIALLTLLVVGLLRSHADILRALHDLGAGVGDPSETGPAGPAAAPDRETDARAPDVVGPTPTGDALAVAVSGVEHDTLLAFLTGGCMTCRDIWDGLGPDGLGAPQGVRVVVVTRSEGQESPSRVAELAAPVQAPVVMSSAAWEAYQVPVSPYFVYVEGSTGRIRGEGAVGRWQQVLDFVAQSQADEAMVRGRAALAADRAARRRLDALAADHRRESRADRELSAAGILPGDPRLHFPEAPEPVPGEERD